MHHGRGLLISSWVLIGGALLFYLLSVTGFLFGGPSSPADLGVYSVTIMLLLFGVGGLLLRWSRGSGNSQ
jgi:Zn-dependent protease with chaperone function